MSRHIVIAGASAALAQPLIDHFLAQGDSVTGVYRPPFPMRCHERFFPVSWAELGSETTIWNKPADVLVTLTGKTLDGRLVYTSRDNWDAVLDATLTAPYEALRRVLPHMPDNGNVVVVGSVVGSTGGYGCGAYAAAKAGLVGLVRAAANENASRGICINLLELGYIDAGMGARLKPEVKERILPTIPLGRFGAVEDVVAAVDYLSRVRYATGNILTLAGGLR